MDRARRAGSTALIVIVMVAAIGGSGGEPALAGIVAWPTSTLVVSEVQTGGASASDEFVELANQGATAVDLVGLEVVYATSSGSTVTRKATWAGSTVLQPGRRFLLANSAGIHSALADVTYSGGFAATGGAVVLRVVGGAAIDALGWGDATNTFVEGTAAAAPPAGSSLERAPGGSAGNGRDTNDNATDWFVQASPSPQGLAAAPVPAPGPSVTASATPTPTATTAPTVTPAPSATPTSTPGPTAAPTATIAPTIEPTATPVPTPTTAPTPTPVPTPTLTPTPVPTPTPIDTPTPTPVAIPTPTISTIATARGLGDGTTVTIAGVLTTALGSLEDGRSGFVQDPTGGIALYLDAPVTGGWPAGTTVTVEGSVSSRYAQRTLRISETSIIGGPMTTLPVGVSMMTGEATEPGEGLRILVAGTVTESPDELADGLGITIDDGSGPVRAVIGPDALDGRTVETGMVATVRGPLGQRDSSGTGAAGYRVYATLPGELELTTAPSETPTAVPTPVPTASLEPTASPIPSAEPTSGPTSTPAPTAVPTPAPTAAPTVLPTLAPSPTPSPSATATTIAEIRTRSIGTRVTVRGVVIAEAGRLGIAPLLAIGDATGGLVVRLPAGAGTYRRGASVEVGGKLAAPYGQLEIRPTRTEIRALGSVALPAPLPIGGATLDETLEGRLVSTSGRLARKPTRTAAGDITLVMERDGGTVIKVTADVTSRITVGSLKVGTTYRIVGVIGQRASRSGALDGYRIWVRDGADLVAGGAAGPSSSPAPTSSAGPSASASAGTVTIAQALRITDRTVAIDAIVTAPANLLDSTGRRIVVQDATGAIELLLPTGSTAPSVGTRIRAEGRIGVAYGAPRLRADSLTVLGSARTPAPAVLRTAPGVAQEWRLVTVTGRITDVRKLADRWRAEIHVGTHELVVVGQPGAGIASTALVEGRNATVTGIVRRPYPNATDRRFAVTPRSPSDIVTSSATGSGQRAATASGDLSVTTASANPADSTQDAVPDANLIDLEAFLGRMVRVGGLVVDLTTDGFTLDDGTSIGRVVLRGAALDDLVLVEPDDALNAIGRVEATAGGPVIVVEDPAGVIRAGDPVAVDPSVDPSPMAVGPTPAASAGGQPGGRLASLGGGPISLDPGAAGLGTLLAISAASLAVTLLRRAHARRRAAARIAGRLATFAGPSTSPPASPAGVVPAERGPSTIHSA